MPKTIECALVPEFNLYIQADLRMEPDYTACELLLMRYYKRSEEVVLYMH